MSAETMIKFSHKDRAATLDAAFKAARSQVKGLTAA